ncbi:MAG: replication protein [Pseudomonadota bacterium]
MAGPQVEEGFTRLAHGYLEALVRADITGREMRVLMVIARNTWGRHGSPKFWPLGLTYLANATSLDRRNVGKIITRLIDRKMVLEGAPKSGTTPRELGIQKHPERWASVVTTATPSVVTEGTPSVVAKDTPSVVTADTLADEGVVTVDTPVSSPGTHQCVHSDDASVVTEATNKDRDFLKTSLRQEKRGDNAPASPSKKPRGSRVVPKTWNPKPEAMAKAVARLGQQGASRALENFRLFEFKRPYTDWDRCWARWYQREPEMRGRPSLDVPDPQATDYGEIDLARSALGGSR